MCRTMPSLRSANKFRLSVSMDRVCMREAVRGVLRWIRRHGSLTSARYAYMFIAISLLSWIIRDYGSPVMTKLQKLHFVREVGTVTSRDLPDGFPIDPDDNHINSTSWGFKDCARFGKDCLRAEGVLRVSFGGYLFYSFMALSTAALALFWRFYDLRERWQTRMWLAKIVLLACLIVVSFFIPSGAIHFFGRSAIYCAAVFLVLQLITTIAFIVHIRDWYERQVERRQIYLRIGAVILHSACIAAVIFFYAHFTLCSRNILFITGTLILYLAPTGVSLYPMVNLDVVFVPGVLGAYMLWLCFSAISNEPLGDVCSKNNGASKKWETILGFVAGVIFVAFSAYSTAIDNMFQLRREEYDVYAWYAYPIKHFVFAMGCMYSAMIMIGWDSNHDMRRWTLDGTWASTWIIMGSQWFAAAVYAFYVFRAIWRRRRAAI